MDWVSGAAMLIRRSALEQVGGFDETFGLYGEELDLCTRLRDVGWKVLATPELEIMHVGGVSTGRSRRTYLMHSQSIYRYFRKHRQTGWRRASAAVCVGGPPGTRRTRRLAQPGHDPLGAGSHLITGDPILSRIETSRACPHPPGRRQS